MKKQPKTGAEVKVLSSLQVVGKAKKEMGLQNQLNRMQISISKGEWKPTPEAELAQKEIDRFNKQQAELRSQKLHSIADYSGLKALYESKLIGITKDSLADEMAARARKFAERSLNPLNKIQADVVARYYAIQAGKNWQVIAQVKALLDIAYKKEAAKVEAIANAADHQEEVGAEAPVAVVNQ